MIYRDMSRTLGDMPTRTVPILLALCGVLAAMGLLRLGLGPDGLGWPASPDEWWLRSGRVVAGIIVGASLGAGGVMLQSLLRNPLASPDLIGAAGGASLAVALATYARGTWVLPAIGTELAGLATIPAALIGALVALALVYLLAQRRGFVEPVSLVLVGVMVSIIAGAGTALVSHLMPPNLSFSVTRWTVGGLSDDTSPRVLVGSGVAAAGVVMAGVFLGRAMDVAALGEDEARASGVNVRWLRAVLFVGAGVLTAAAVVLAGPIGFIGLVAPHAVRLLSGPAHRPLVLGAAVAGAVLVLGADAAVRVIRVETGRLPLGVVTALAGGPIFILLLRSSRDRAAYT